jgi:signal transduction histidine kinase/DNA-binding response OmpR family regulator
VVFSIISGTSKKSIYLVALCLLVASCQLVFMLLSQNQASHSSSNLQSDQSSKPGYQTIPINQIGFIDVQGTLRQNPATDSQSSDGPVANNRSARISMVLINCLIFAGLFLLLKDLLSSKQSHHSLTRQASDNRMNPPLADHFELKKLLRVKDTLLKHISHEFKTPLTVLTAYMKEIEAGLEANCFSKRGLVIRQIKHLNQLVEQILDLSRIESTLEIEKLPLNLSKELSELIPMFDSYARQLGVEVTSTIHQNLTIDAEKSSLTRVVNNLISNAIKYNRRGGRVEIIAKQETGVIVLTIRDTGIGIADEHKDVLFKQFGKVENKELLDHAVLSTGLGLAIVKEGVKINSGVLEFKSEVGVGSEFTVTFPVSSQRVQTVDKAPDSSRSASNRLPVQKLTICDRKKTILIVDDTDDIRGLLEEKLSTDFNVICAKNGSEGFTVAKKIKPDMILTDILMPVVDGLEMIKLIKDDACTRHCPVLFLSAIESRETQLSALRLGAVDFICKPFCPDTVMVKLKNIMAQIENSNPSTGNQNRLNINNRSQGNAKAPWFLQRLDQYIEKNIEQKISVENMANSLGMNRSAFTRKVKDITSLNTQQYILRFRLQKAYEMLPHAKTVAEVAFSLGFNTQNHLSTAFSKQYGITCRERIGNKELVKEVMLVSNL